MGGRSGSDRRGPRIRRRLRRELHRRRGERPSRHGELDYLSSLSPPTTHAVSCCRLSSSPGPYFFFFSSARVAKLLRDCSGRFICRRRRWRRRFRALRRRVGKGRGEGVRAEMVITCCLVFLRFERIEEFCSGPEMRCFRTARAD